MKGINMKLYLAALAVLMTCCACDANPKNEDGGTEDGRTAMERYWAEDYAGKLGIQVKDDDGVPTMCLADESLYVTGVNCFNLFTQSFATYDFPTNNVGYTFEVLSSEDVPVVRFSCIPYYAKDYDLYFEHKEKFLETLDFIATLADECHIGLIPSIFWKPYETSLYFGEEYKEWGDKDSRTYAFMLEYTRDVVNTLKGHKSVWAWEFGNEFNLDADIDIAGYPELSANDVKTAYTGFSELVMQLDPQKRLVASGNSVMRNASYHLFHDKNWDTDSFDEYVEISGVMTPDPMLGMSEHIYEEDRMFSDKGTVSREEQIRCAQEAAARNGKVYYIGEFTGPRGADEALMRKNFEIYLKCGVQLSLVWNYALKGDVEHSFSAGNELGDRAFSLMREYNGKFSQLEK